MSEQTVSQAFLRTMWQEIPSDVDSSWVERIATQDAHQGPLGDQGPLVRKMLDAGLTSTDIARFARIVSYEVVFGVCSHLDDPPREHEGLTWALFETNAATDEPIRPIWGLHEELLVMDPSGTEMRPPGS